eukprot:CAMPEP_0198494780 /NCGR_PEP_ID=MMETSP1462-20131121/4813_1 /TAXON_ID=1333877 /ORGANISM="Brandtodinium nutriculum, Strain RCC3387" /LENGTH=233 /DNA_ID=CAMNT_0044223525 /DNA_START=41 /DNA_END=739 /DNA_ORIENTATION=+
MWGAEVHWNDLRVRVRTLTGDAFLVPRALREMLPICYWDVRTLKRNIERVKGIPVLLQVLIHDGAPLSDDDRLHSLPPGPQGLEVVLVTSSGPCISALHNWPSPGISALALRAAVLRLGPGSCCEELLRIAFGKDVCWQARIRATDLLSAISMPGDTYCTDCLVRTLSEDPQESSSAIQHHLSVCRMRCLDLLSRIASERHDGARALFIRLAKLQGDVRSLNGRLALISLAGL